MLERIKRFFRDQRGEANPTPPTAPAPPSPPADWREPFIADSTLAPIVKDITEPDLPSVLKSYHGLKGQLGKAVFLKDPKNADEVKKAQARAYEMGIFQKPNVPESPDKYQITRPDSIREDMWSKDIENKARQWAHKHNVPQEAMTELVALEGERFGGMSAAMEKMKQETDAADTEWAKAEGLTLEQVDDRVVGYLTRHFMARNVNADDAAAAVKRMTDQGFFHAPGVRQLLATAMKETGEDVSMTGSQTDPTVDQASAQKIADDIILNKDNPKYKLFHAGDKNVRDEVEQLYAKAHPGMTTL